MFLLLPFVSSFLFAYLQYLVTFFLSRDQKNRKDRYRTSIRLSYHPWKCRTKAKKISSSIFKLAKLTFKDHPNWFFFFFFASWNDSMPSAQSATLCNYSLQLAWFMPRISGKRAGIHSVSGGMLPGRSWLLEWTTLALQEHPCQNRMHRGQSSICYEWKSTDSKETEMGYLAQNPDRFLEPNLGTR